MKDKKKGEKKTGGAGLPWGKDLHLFGTAVKCQIEREGRGKGRDRAPDDKRSREKEEEKKGGTARLARLLLFSAHRLMRERGKKEKEEGNEGE